MNNNPASINLLSGSEHAGCSAKLDPKLLRKLIEPLALPCADPRLLVGTASIDDAAVYKLNDEQALVFTTDFFPPVCSDPYTFGRIAAANALSDIYAMGATPLMALNLMMYPEADKMPTEGLAEIFRGGQDTVSEAGALLVGGHTICDDAVKYGLAVVGLVHPDKVFTNAGVQKGDALILTKPLGTGVLIAAHRLGLAREEAYQEALNSMMILNRDAMKAARNYPVHAVTDVTGFGLLGHAMQMAEASKMVIDIESSALPLLPQVSVLVKQGCVPAAASRNRVYVDDKVLNYACEDELMPACDAQTSGGLLIALPAEQATSLLKELQALPHCASAAIIGMAKEEAQEGKPYLRLW